MQKPLEWGRTTTATAGCSLWCNLPGYLTLLGPVHPNIFEPFKDCASPRMQMIPILRMQIKCSVEMQLTLTPWILTSSADICKSISIVPVAHICILFGFGHSVQWLDVGSQFLDQGLNPVCSGESSKS